ncbi:hypothetical protein HKX48_002657 [Thoreauomyces humboldtii]|nr:hypothetical protein HKX48_002657 [Thoreauomyces humboldtii]
MGIREHGEIPPGTARVPQRIETSPAFDPRRMPPGFVNVCPFPGYDPDRVDRAALPVSAIYGKLAVTARAVGGASTISPVMNAQARAKMEQKMAAEVPDGFTSDRHPVLWPSRLTDLRSARNPTDFPINAPVLFDIIQPGATHLQRVMTRVTSINKEMAAVSVQRDADEDDMLSVGATFNIFIRTRQNPAEWISVNLEVVDDDYQDDITFGRPKTLVASAASSLASLANIREKDENRAAITKRQSTVPASGVAAVVAPSNLPVPSGFTSQGEPYFAPPINMPPSPVGYTTIGVPYFGRTSSVKPPPMGVTTLGTRFYSANGLPSGDQSSRNHLAGYDNLGHPFFIPRGCTVPPPAGFTTDGIAYYDIPSLMHHRGVMVLPPQAAAKADWPVFDDDSDEEWEETRETSSGMASVSTSQVNLNRNSRTAKKKQVQGVVDQALLTAQLVDSLEESQPQLKQSFLKGHQRAVGTVRRVAEFKRLRGVDEDPDSDAGSDIDDDLSLQDPVDIVGFLRDSDDLAYLRPNNIRVQIEPSILDFQSVHAPVTKAAVLRYRAGRGDYGERDFFVSVEPVDVFAVKLFHLKLQGEGVMEIGVTYYPTAMKTDRVEGSLNLIDDSGKKMGSCTMVAIRQSFVKVSPTSIDAGWTLPDRRKEVLVTIENVSSISATITIQLQSELQAQNAQAAEPSTVPSSRATTASSPVRKLNAKDDEERRRSERVSAFVLPLRQLKLQPHETKNLAVYFDPTKLGHFSDVVEINGPGGDLIHVKIAGMAGIPIAVYPESEENSRAGAAELTRERCNFMRKFRRPDPTARGVDKSHVVLTADDTSILKNMMSATSDQDSRKEAHTMDFGICPSEPHTRMRCLTLMNLADTPVTVGLYPHHPSLTCPYLVRIAPRMANTVEVTFEYGGPDTPPIPGNLRTAIEVICPEFQNIPLSIRAFVGQPLFFPTWDYAFFKPCRINRQTTLTMSLVNESHYQLHAVVEGLRNPDRVQTPGTGTQTETAVAAAAVSTSGQRSFITTSLSTEEALPSVIQPFSTVPVTFTFLGRERGPLLQSINLKLVKPFELVIPAAMLSRTLYFVGICIEPYVHRPGELPDKNSIDFLRMWMSHPKRLLDEYPTTEEKIQRFDLNKPTKAYTPGSTDCDVTFARDPVTFRAGPPKTGANVGMDSTVRRSQMQPIQVQNSGSQSRNVVFFTSTSLSVDPRAKSLQPADADSVDIMFLPPLDISESVTTYGFAAALVDHDHTFHAVQALGKPVSDILVFPVPNKDNNVILEFGKVEISAQALDVNLKHVVLSNTYETSYSWNVKFVSKQKFSAFDAGMIMGELQTFETFAIPFRFHCDTSGTFETTAEIYIKETLDRLAKPVKLASVILRGQTVNTAMSGLPDTLDFGSTVVYHKKKKKFIMTNSGSTDAQVTILSRPPFDVSPKSFELGPKTQQEISITYTPTESRTSQIKMLAFSNHKLYLILLTGTGGTAELMCEKYENKDVDFGFQREGTVGFLSLHLTNKGTLPLTLRAVTADNLELVKLEYLTVTSTVPYEVNSGQGRVLSNVVVRRDYWSILKRKFKVFCALKQLLAGSTSVKKSKAKERRTDSVPEEEGKTIRVFRTGGTEITDPAFASQLPHLPQLRPFYSYHFRLGYTSRYQARKDTNLLFHYMPITTEEDAESTAALIKNMSVHVVGGVYRQLELYPPYHDFGLASAETFILPDARKSAQRELIDAYGVQRETQKDGEAVLQLEVLNMSMEAQNVTLQFINNEFTVNGRTWTLQAGDKITIPVEFHPPKEQVQYHGEARFIHNYGTSVIRLAGTGASADLSTEAIIDFGSLKVGSIGARTLSLHNRGLLDCRYALEVVQAGQEFSLLCEEPFDHEGVIESGGVDSLEIECNCERILETPAQVIIRWLRVPMGAWEEMVIPLLVQVGMPVFRLQNMELDFHTTYINVNKTLIFLVTNDGNAVCNWEAATEFSSLTVEPSGGALLPGETLTLEVTFAPLDYESLHHSLTFYTDVGTKTLMCYGIVGVPYLKIPDDSMYIDFGIVGINKTHNRSVVLMNTGKRHIEFEITLGGVTHDGMEVAPDDFDIFFINPTHDIIEPGASMTVTMQTMPREYNAVYAGEWIIRTRDGEQYRGRLSATGGKAIIKLAPPSMMHEELQSKKQATAEMSKTSGSGRATTDNELFRASTAEAARQNFQSHLDNLQEVLAGLRAAELDMRMDADTAATAASGLPQAGQRSIQSPRPPTGEMTASRPTTPRRRPTSSSSETAAEEKLAKEEQRKRGTRIMDGSDVRARSRQGARARTTAGRLGDEDRETESRSGAHSARMLESADPDAASAAIRYMDELSLLENELDTALGLHDSDSHGLGGLSRYHPGTPRSRGTPRRSREAAIRDMLASGGEAGLDGTPTGRRSARTTRSGRRRPESAAVVELPRSSVMEDLETPISDLISQAQEMMKDAAGAGDSAVERVLLAVASEQILEKTRNVIKAVKEQLASPWIENRDFLGAALRRLQETALVMETLAESPDAPADSGGSDFNMGLLKAGERSAPILLFNLPNVGNLGFDYLIQKKSGDSMTPPGHNPSVDAFMLDPPSGDIAPRESVNISATFTALVPGTYQQAYELISGGEVVLTFTATARVGAPLLQLNPQSLDFGLVARQKAVSRTFSVDNVGTYRDLFRIEAVVANAGGSDGNSPTELPFVLSTYKGEVEPGASFPIQVTFLAPQEGNYTQKFRLTWSKDPMLFECKGCGGGLRIKAVYLDEKDIKFGGLDWGNCVVGVAYEKLFHLTNIGNVEGVVDLSHSNDCFRYEVARDQNGDIRVGPGDIVPVKIIYWPSRSDTLKEGVAVRLPEDGQMIIPLRAVSGLTDWKVEGDLRLLNMPVLEIQNSTFKITNTGDLDIPLGVRLDPGNLGPTVTLRLGPTPWKSGDQLKPNQTITVDITVAPRTPEVIEGALVFTTDLGKGAVDNTHTFRIRAYEEQLGVDAESDISVGRIMIGETASVTRSLTNYGSSKIKYRIRLEAIPDAVDDAGDTGDDKRPRKSAKKKSGSPRTPGTAEKPKNWTQAGGTSWKLNGEIEGVLAANEAVPFDAVFECLDDDEDWQEAKVVVEKCVDVAANRWVQVTTFKLVGASGNPKLRITPNVHDFHDTGVGDEKRAPLAFFNEGSATVNYEILSDWDWDSVFYFAPDTPLTGKIDPEQTASLFLCFKPDNHVDFASEIKVKTQLETLVVKVAGLGAEYRIHTAGFPESIDFGVVGFGSSETRKLAVANDCIYDIRVACAAFVTSPVSGHPDPALSTEVQVTPSVVQLSANRRPDERSSESFALRIDAPLPITPAGALDADAVTSLVRRGIQTAYLRTAIVGGSAHVVPVAYRWGLKQIVALLAGTTLRDGAKYLESDRYRDVDFGEAGIEAGASLTFNVHNPNGFAIQFTANVTDIQFELSPESGSISPQGMREFTCTLLPYSNSESVPQSETYSGFATITTNVDALEVLSLPLLGTLVDEPLPLTAPPPLLFGPVLAGKSSELTFAFRNPVRRPIAWEFHVDPAYADVFELTSAASGTLGPRQEATLRVQFKPIHAVTYGVAGYVTTEEGSFPVTLDGTGVTAALELDRRHADFGVVGVGHPEFREVTIRNPTELEMRVGARTSSADFSTDVKELRIPAGESRTVKVYYNPTTTGEAARGRIAFFCLDQLTEEEEKEEDDDDDWEGAPVAVAGNKRTRPLTGGERILEQIELEGAAGEFGFKASSTDDETVDGPEELNEDGTVKEARTVVGGSGPAGNAIRLAFPRIPDKQRVRKRFEVENVGDTVIDVGITDAAGRLLSPDVDSTAPNGTVSYRITPSATLIRPNSKQSFTVEVSGVRAGDEKFRLSLQTRTLAAPKTVPIEVITKVVGQMELLGDSLRTFARADNSIETLIDYERREHIKYGGDTEVWKILLPIVRVAPGLPSDEWKTVPVLEPSVATPGVESYTVRPPALPRELPPRAKKWYMNRMSMGLEQAGRAAREDQASRPDVLRRQAAADFVSPVEKKVYLEKTARRM